MIKKTILFRKKAAICRLIHIYSGLGGEIHILKIKKYLVQYLSTYNVQTDFKKKKRNYQIREIYNVLVKIVKKNTE